VKESQNSEGKDKRLVAFGPGSQYPQMLPNEERPMKLKQLSEYQSQ
jgi:hypothetical protein